MNLDFFTTLSIVLYIFRLYRLHEMRTIAIDDSEFVCQSVQPVSLSCGGFAVQKQLNGSSWGIDS